VQPPTSQHARLQRSRPWTFGPNPVIAGLHACRDADCLAIAGLTIAGLTIAARVLDELGRARRPLDDDELARGLGESTRTLCFRCRHAFAIRCTTPGATNGALSVTALRRVLGL
jgi:hypothetical protein